MNEHCPICVDWSAPRNCGHGWINGMVAPSKFFVSCRTRLGDAGGRADRYARAENEGSRSARLEHVERQVGYALGGGWKAGDDG